MRKVDLEKNTLDLAYRRNLNLLNIILISGLGAIFAYVGALILNPEKVVSYTFVLGLVATITYILYRKIDDKLKIISERIKGLT